jgi:hypothetical protein
LANAARVFVYNQELTQDIGNCVFPEKVVAVHLHKNVLTVCVFLKICALFPRTQCCDYSSPKPCHATVHQNHVTLQFNFLPVSSVCKRDPKIPGVVKKNSYLK